MAWKSIEIEFFHDTICSFCFPMSYRMRQLQEKMPHAQIFHRSFALVKKPEDFDDMFGSREAAMHEVYNTGNMQMKMTTFIALILKA